MLDMPAEIKPGEPVELTRMEYRFVVDRLRGMIFHRIDNDGRYWIKCSVRACEFVSHLLDQSRREPGRKT